MLGFFLNVLVYNGAEGISEEYAQAISDRYTTLYYERCIPGVSIGLLFGNVYYACLLYTSPSPRDQRGSRMPSSA